MFGQASPVLWLGPGCVRETSIKDADNLEQNSAENILSKFR